MVYIQVLEKENWSGIGLVVVVLITTLLPLVVWALLIFSLAVFCLKGKIYYERAREGNTMI